MDKIETVMCKYIAGGFEEVKYDPLSGKCWIERTKGGESKIVAEFNPTTPLDK